MTEKKKLSNEETLTRRYQKISTGRSQRVLKKVGFVIAAMIILVVWGLFFRGFILDDAYITYRFSDHLASGQGLTWNGTGDRVEGFTSMSVVLLGAFGQKFLGVKPEILIPLLCIASWLVLIGLVIPNFGEAIFKDLGTFSYFGKWMIILAIGLNPIFAIHAFNGMETMIYALILGSLSFFAIKKLNPRRSVVMVILSLLAVMTRPDAVAFLGPLLFVLLLFEKDWSGRKRYIKIIFLLVLIVVMYWAVRGWYFKSLFPNPYYIKSATTYTGPLPGLNHVGAFLLIILGPIWLYIAFAAGKIGILGLIRDRIFLCLFFPSIFFVIAFIRFQPMMSWEFRFLIPIFPALLVSIIRVWVLTKNTQPSSELPKNKDLLIRNSEPTAVLIIILLVIQGIASVYSSKRYLEYRHYCISVVQEILVKMGKNLSSASFLKPKPLLATGEVGAIPYYSKLPTMDLIGLSDRFVAHNGLTHDYLKSRQPDLLVLQDVYMVPCSVSRLTDRNSSIMQIDGIHYCLDESKYHSISGWASKLHNGFGSTFQVLTMPGFHDQYKFMGLWSSRGSASGYWIFLRKEYLCYDELKSIIELHELGRWPKE
jgi:arabinofuranosyltransferase